MNLSIHIDGTITKLPQPSTPPTQEELTTTALNIISTEVRKVTATPKPITWYKQPMKIVTSPGSRINEVGSIILIFGISKTHPNITNPIASQLLRQTINEIQAPNETLSVVGPMIIHTDDQTANHITATIQQQVEQAKQTVDTITKKLSTNGTNHDSPDFIEQQIKEILN